MSDVKIDMSDLHHGKNCKECVNSDVGCEIDNYGDCSISLSVKHYLNLEKALNQNKELRAALQYVAKELIQAQGRDDLPSFVKRFL